eukprot:CAMPEP_0182917844 /NCGR_PEP_ID=MMETSP0105_2-20130417/1738_1 /TAXON_ID=81532 ORGANISM="Acanthoeca-like sp., Strain 10tr" /NCGR_SAMPLE_ID=MMETSP0105_2 /ASSEMBLY_ACC=CAM_ASM_000205 /LENGTH=146 /DNA_ID=CAMNT_0025054863 /DNA_START=1 /DNA_END=441 /DNA_ORIENTATION=+
MEGVEGREDGVVGEGPGLVTMFLAGGGWREPWFVALVAFHALCTLAILTTPPPAASTVRNSVFCLLCAVGLLQENLNTMAALHWQEFAREQHFDHQGIFLLQVLGLPLLLNLVLVVVVYMRQASHLMVQLKQLQAKRRARCKAKAE